jgi:hypothetical protein
VVLGSLAVVTGLGAVWVVLRWRRTAADVFGRPPPPPWWGAGSLAALCLLTGGLAVRDHVRESRLSAAASALAGRSVEVRCQSWAGSFTDANVEPGYVRWEADGSPASETTLKADVCRTLAGYLKSPGRPSEADVVAVHIVTHEAMHMAGLKDEAAAECAAVQRDARTARLLGARPAEAAELAARYWTDVYPRMPDDYRSTECGPGRSLDEALGDGPWTS